MLNRIRRAFHVLLLGLVTLALIFVAAWNIEARIGTRRVVIAAGAANSETYVVMQALKAVTEKYHPRFKILIHETGGTTENLAALEHEEADLATAQADGLLSPDARTVAVLFPDVFQILAHRGANIRQFADLKGKRIAIPKAGGQHQSFLNVASHYGLGERDFTVVGPSEESADLAYVKGDADAIFRVRALENASMRRLAQTTDSVVVPIDQAAALHLELPVYSATTIPKGAYSGNPPVPEADTITISAPRFLVSDQDTDRRVVRAVTEVLMEHRQELQAAVSETQPAVKPLAAGAHPPDPLGSTLSPGAREYYRHDQTAELTHWDWIGAGLGLAALIALWSWALRRRRQIIQESVAAEYRHRAAALIQEAWTAPKGRAVRLVRAELICIVPQVVQELQKRRLSEAHVQTIRSLAEFGIATARDRMRDSEPPRLHTGNGKRAGSG